MNAQLKHLELTEYIGNETAHAHARITALNEGMVCLFVLLGLVVCLFTAAVFHMGGRIRRLHVMESRLIASINEANKAGKEVWIDIRPRGM